jgi:hypothetical protein
MMGKLLSQMRSRLIGQVRKSEAGVWIEIDCCSAQLASGWDLAGKLPGDVVIGSEKISGAYCNCPGSFHQYWFDPERPSIGVACCTMNTECQRFDLFDVYGAGLKLALLCHQL